LREKTKFKRGEEKVQVQKTEKKKNLGLNKSNLKKEKEVYRSKGKGKNMFENTEGTKSVKGEIKSEKQNGKIRT